MTIGLSRRAAIGLLVIALAALTIGAAVAKGGGNKIKAGIDVACNANSFVFQGPSTPDGPDYGASFVVQGVIYPGGTFDNQGVSSGLLADGTPEFPELVIGQWTCRGWFIGEGMTTKTGPFVATTQIYAIADDGYGTGTVVTDGTELIDLNVPFARAITGGSGDFVKRRARGQLYQTGVGVNATGLFNFTFRFKP